LGRIKEENRKTGAEEKRSRGKEEKSRNRIIPRRDVGRLEDMSQVPIRNPWNVARAKALENLKTGESERMMEIKEMTERISVAGIFRNTGDQ
jgi:hypothetical protein